MVSEVFWDAFLFEPAHMNTHSGTAAKQFYLKEAQAQTLMKRQMRQLLVMNTMFIGAFQR
jgi:hypothetical protein